ncbi:MAG: hypothetical protein QMD53_02150 [Actinomycetota bacterium]|nr:hypothetical protein [Actinomycetota bacterium]
MKDQILLYREMCDAEKVQTLQRGMNYRLNTKCSVILMSQRSNAPYNDKIHDDGITIEYEGHDIPRTKYEMNPKEYDQPYVTITGRLTQNGLFAKAAEDYENKRREAEIVKVCVKNPFGRMVRKRIF